MLEQYLKAFGFNRTKIGDLLMVSPPSTRILLENPSELKVSQVLEICKATKTNFQDISGLIFDTHYIVMENENVTIKAK